MVGRGSKTFQDFPRGRLIYLVDTNSGSYTTGVLINIHTAAGANTCRRTAPKLSTTWDFMRGASTKRRYFWLGGLLALVLGV